jgi:hypothetical protein
MEQKNVTTCIQELVIDIDELKDHSLVIHRLQWWELVLGISFYTICAVIGTGGSILIIFYIVKYAPKDRPINRMILVDLVSLNFQI